MFVAGCVNNFRVFRFSCDSRFYFHPHGDNNKVCLAFLHRVQLWRRSGRDEVCQKPIDNDFPPDTFPSSAGERFHFSFISSAWKCFDGKAAGSCKNRTQSYVHLNASFISRTKLFQLLIFAASPSFSFIYERVDNCQVQPDEVSKVLQTSFLSLFKHPKNHSSTLHNAWGCCWNN